MDNIIQLYPSPTRELPIKNLYLMTPPHNFSSIREEVMVFTNFITSLDGRIAVADSPRGKMTIPTNIANSRDWRLVQELAVQADILITSGRYLRGVAKGRGQKIFQAYEDPQFVDLKEWREKSGMKPMPDLAVISNNLDFPIPQSLSQGDRVVLIFSTNRADPRKVQSLESQGGKVILSETDHVGGKEMVRQMNELGYRKMYSLTGPKVFHLLLEADVLDRLYLTIANRIIGGGTFSTIVEGELLQPTRGFQLRTLYYDPYGLDGLGQLFACYDRVRNS